MECTENKIATAIVDTAVNIHKALGPGLFEKVYETILCHELKLIGYQVETQVPIPIHYKGIVFDAAYRADLLVNNKVIIELKSIEKINPVHAKQTLTYIKLANLKLGLLLNFGSNLMKDGIYRLVNNLPEQNPHGEIAQRH